MHIFKDGKLCDLNEGDAGDWFLDSILVLEGDYTNPENKKEMVDVILGLYAMVLISRDTRTKHLYELVNKYFERVFPEEYFQDLPYLLSKMVANNQELTNILKQSMSLLLQRKDL